MFNHFHSSIQQPQTLLFFLKYKVVYTHIVNIPLFYICYISYDLISMCFSAFSDVREDEAFPPLPSEAVQFDETGDKLK